MKLALRIDVSTRLGAKEGVPRLIDMLAQHHARATFFLALGPDRLWGQGSLPGRESGRRWAGIFRSIRDAGFEAGIQAFDPVRWPQRIAQADAAWTKRQLELSCEAFLRLFDTPPHAHGATDWQMNCHAWRLTQRVGFRYASDARGICPFIPVRNAEIVACPQLPTTLPTLDEVAARDGVALEDSVPRILEVTARPVQAGHVFSLRADREGLNRATLFERLLEGWRAQGYALAALDDCLEDVNLARLPRHNIVEGALPGRTSPVALQGKEFLA